MVLSVGEVQPRVERNKEGDPVKTFIIQVAALSWAATQLPEITVAIQSFLKAGFLSAVQVELSFMAFISLQRQPDLRVSGILFLNIISAVIVGETRNSLWNATMVRRRGARQASQHALPTELIRA